MVVALATGNGPIRDARVESLMADMGVRWRGPVAVPVQAADQKYRWQTRAVRQVDAGTVEAYAVAMRRGVAFSPIVLASLPDGTYGVIGGYHRLAAARHAGVRELAAYLVDERELAVLDRLARSLNTVEAVTGQSVAERLVNAKDFVQGHGWTQKRAAAHFGVPEGTLSNALRAEYSRARLQEYGLAKLALPDAVLAELTPLTNRPVLTACARLAHDAHLGSQLVRDLMREVRAAPSEAEQLAVVTAWRQRPGVQRAATRGHPAGVATVTQGPISPLVKLGNLTRWIRRVALHAETRVVVGQASPETRAALQADWDALDAQVRAVLWPSA